MVVEYQRPTRVCSLCWTVVFVKCWELIFCGTLVALSMEPCWTNRPYSNHNSGTMSGLQKTITLTSDQYDKYFLYSENLSSQFPTGQGDLIRLHAVSIHFSKTYSIYSHIKPRNAANIHNLEENVQNAIVDWKMTLRINYQNSCPLFFNQSTDWLMYF